MPQNTIAQNLPIFYSAAGYTLTTATTVGGAAVNVPTESSPLPAPPTTTSLVSNPSALIVNEVVGAQHY